MKPLMKFGRYRETKFHLWHVGPGILLWVPSGQTEHKVSLWPGQRKEFGSRTALVEPGSSYRGTLGDLDLSLVPTNTKDYWHIGAQIRRKRACSVRPVYHLWIANAIREVVEQLVSRDRRFPELAVTWLRSAGANAVELNPHIPADPLGQTKKGTPRTAPTIQNGVVYFVQGGPGTPIKIGFTVELDARIRSLQTASAVALNVLATVDGGRADEREFHHRFASLRMHGEWFRPDAELLAYIASLGPRSSNPKVDEERFVLVP